MMEADTAEPRDVVGVRVTCRLSWSGRAWALLGGEIHVHTRVSTENVVGRTLGTTADVEVWEPAWFAWLARAWRPRPVYMTATTDDAPTSPGPGDAS